MTPSPARRLPWIVLAYLGPLAVIPLVATQLAARGPLARGSAVLIDSETRPAIAWHAWQGFLLALVETLVLGAAVVSTAYAALANVAVGVTVGVITWVLWFVVVGLHLAAIVAGLADRRLEIPGLASLASRLSAG